MQLDHDRRRFLQMSVAAGALLGGLAQAQGGQGTADTKSKGLKILILGGTGFIGPQTVEAALARGHELTLFNRGKRNPHLFPKLEKLLGDRDPNVGDGLKELEGRKFDVVIDNSGYYPRHVAASADLLAKNGCGFYIFVSSISVYAKNDTPGMDETAEVGRMEDPTYEKDMGKSFEFYGPLKVLCEEAAQKAFGDKCAIVRPGYIVGPGDSTDRFTYWPIRTARGGKMLVPGTRDDPLQVIDARDLGEWMVHLGETRTTGVFNACGPEKKLAWGRVIDACKSVTKPTDLEHVWVPTERLAALGRLDLPIWIAPEGETKGFHTVSNARAVKAGLRFREIEDTLAATWAWWLAQPEERRAKPRAGMTAEAEAAALAKLV